jgi:dihydrofolate reductase
MRKLVARLLTTLDGVVEAPEKWQHRYSDDEMSEIIRTAAAQSDAILLGRRSYEELAAFWPSQGSQTAIADYMNGTPKHVVSTTLDTLVWANSTLVDGDVAEEVAWLKQQCGKDIQVLGSITLVRSLLRDGLLDELDLLVHPIVVGGGKRLFDDLRFGTALELVDARALRSGVLSLAYSPARFAGLGRHPGRDAILIGERS